MLAQRQLAIPYSIVAMVDGFVFAVVVNFGSTVQIIPRRIYLATFSPLTEQAAAAVTADASLLQTIHFPPSGDGRVVLSRVDPNFTVPYKQQTSSLLSAFCDFFDAAD